MVFKLATIDTAFAGAEFAFPNDPFVMQQDLSSQVNLKRLPRRAFHMATSDVGATEPKLISITGTMFSSSKLTDIRNFSRYFYQAGLKRLYFGSDAFVYCYPLRLVTSNLGTKTNFIEYRATFITPYSTVNEDARSSYTKTVANANEATFSNASFNNTSGTAPAYIWDWTIANNPGDDGGADITKIEIGDENTLSGSNIKIVWNQSSGGDLAAGETLVISSLYNKEGILKTIFSHIGGTETGVMGRAITVAGNYQQIHRLEPAETPTFSVKLTGNNKADTTIKAQWHKAHWM